jgi:hypothetical protein
MGYEIRVIAFIDILGFKDAIQKSETNEYEYNRIRTALTELREFFISPKDHFEIEADRKLGADTQILQVSDSLVISRLIQEQGGIYYMLSDCAFAIHLLISNGFLCRGAIKVGKMHHTETTLFGPAFVEAYTAESNEKLPVVKFDKELFDIVRHFPGPANEGYEDWEIEFIRKNCKKLDSGEYYIDYFTDYDDRVGGGEGSASVHYYDLRKIIVAGLEFPKEIGVYKKYLWAAEQFNKTAENFELDQIFIES